MCHHNEVLGKTKASNQRNQSGKHDLEDALKRIVCEYGARSCRQYIRHTDYA